MIRVISGKLRGRGVDSPPAHRQVRPTTGLIRESIFNRFQMEIPGGRFLDLFAGSGIMGLEALSRGAAFVLGVEADAAQCKAIRKNYAAIGLTETEAKVIHHDARTLVAKACREAGFDFIFMDPPYGFAALPEMAANCQAHGWLNPRGWLVVEQGPRDPDLPGFARKDYGSTSLLFWQAE